MIISCWVITASRPTTANNGGRLVSSGVPQRCICSVFFNYLIVIVSGHLMAFAWLSLKASCPLAGT